MCRICETYVKHVNLRRGRADDEEPGSEEEALMRDNTYHGRTTEEINDNPMEGTDSDDSIEGTDDDSMKGAKSDGWKSKNMQKLFRLRDFHARRDAFDTNEDERAIGQLEGMMCTLQTEKLRADVDCARVNASWAVAREDLALMKNSLDALTKSHQDLLAGHQLTLDENNALKKQVQESAVLKNSLDGLAKSHQELLARHHSIMEKNTSLKKQVESTCELLVFSAECAHGR